jgi:hypothetical protein
MATKPAGEIRAIALTILIYAMAIIGRFAWGYLYDAAKPLASARTQTTADFKTGQAPGSGTETPWLYGILIACGKL